MLSDEQIIAIADSTRTAESGSCGYILPISFARAIEATVRKQDEALIRQMLKAINAMLTHMGMDEDDWNKPTFDQCRASENAARARLGEGSGHERTN